MEFMSNLRNFPKFFLTLMKLFNVYKFFFVLQKNFFLLKKISHNLSMETFLGVGVGQVGKVSVGLLGSTSFFDKSGNSQRVCRAIGREISNRNSFILVTGGLSGVAETGAL